MVHPPSQLPAPPLLGGCTSHGPTATPTIDVTMADGMANVTASYHDVCGNHFDLSRRVTNSLINLGSYGHLLENSLISMAALL